MTLLWALISILVATIAREGCAQFTKLRSNPGIAYVRSKSVIVPMDSWDVFTAIDIENFENLEENIGLTNKLQHTITLADIKNVTINYKKLTDDLAQFKAIKEMLDLTGYQDSDFVHGVRGVSKHMRIKKRNITINVINKYFVIDNHLSQEQIKIAQDQ